MTRNKEKTEMEPKSAFVGVSARFELARVRVVRS